MPDDKWLQQQADKIVTHLVTTSKAEKKNFYDERKNKEYWILSTPDAFQKRFVAVVISGHPELTGVWSYTLLLQSCIKETSMQPYFTKFGAQDFGLAVLNPHFFGPDDEGDTYHYQLGKMLMQISSDQNLGIIAFSMGGRIAMEFLERHPEYVTRLAGLVLIDPTLPNRLRTDNIRELLDVNTLLIASEGRGVSLGQISSMLLKIPEISFQGIHGEMPNKALGRIIDFFKERLKLQ
jgi:pimeloyl-ACP methyl ester carboxylesterase